MTDLKSILKNDIDRTIDGVIKADDKSSIRMEVEEYVLTREVVKHLDKLIEGYNESINEQKRGKTYPFNGVWISGYFGSGKSHLLKMLAYIIENEEIEGTRLAELFLPKIEVPLLQANFRNILKVPSQSILFNIDQEAIAAPKESDSALLYIFESVFNRHCGYFSNNRGVAEFEQHLDEQGIYQIFRKDYLRISGRPWEDRRKAAFGLARKELVKVLCESQGMNQEEAIGLIDHYKSGSALTIDSLARRIKTWLDNKEGPDFRLNFFIDEVGQFISGKTRLMLNLQTLAETLGTVCEGRVWIFVTSQEDLKSLVGETGKQQVQDFSKINARYHFKIALNSADVQEVIQKRLLDKTVEGQTALGELYMRDQETYRTLFRMDDGGTQIHFRSKEEFTLSYPFQAYQYNLLQQCLKTLSEHNAFRGQHISRGERSMLEIFQDVSKQLKKTELFTWATFDLMFEGIRQTLNTGLIDAVNTAEKHLNDNPLAIRLLKILLMIKYVKTFKATQNHLKILMIQDTDQDLSDLDRKIGESLNQLEYETYIQRNGMEYSYMTNEEKDIEKEIKLVDISHDEIRKILGDMVFSDILKLSSKIRDPELKEDYTYMRMIDTAPLGRPADLSIHLISPEHPNFGDTAILTSQSMGKKELTIILPPDRTFQNDLRLYFQTDQYCRQHQGHETDPKIQNIISAKQTLNNERKSQIRTRLTRLIGESELILMGDKVTITSTDPKNRAEEGFRKLLRRAYPKLRCLGNNHYSEGELKKILYPSDDQALLIGDGQNLDESEQEVFYALERKKAQNTPPSLKNIMDEYGSGQYGWYQMATLCILAKLYSKDKIEFTQAHNVKSRDEVFSLLSSNREYDQVKVLPQVGVSPQDLEAIRNLYLELYHEPLHGTNAKECAIAFKESLFNSWNEIRSWVREYKSQMSFLDKISISALEEISHHERDWYKRDILDVQEDLIRYFTEDVSPLVNFMRGQKDLWLDLNLFYQTHRDNLTELGKHSELMDLEALLNQIPYKEGILRNLKKTVNRLKADLEQEISTKKEDSLQYIVRLQDELMAGEPYQQLLPEDQDKVIKPFESLKVSLEGQNQLARIRDTAQSRGTDIFQKVQMDIEKKLNPEKEIIFASMQEKQVPFGKKTLESEEDVLAYTDALKNHYLELIRQDKRITP